MDSPIVIDQNNEWSNVKEGELKISGQSINILESSSNKSSMIPQQN